jgi:primosomal protein N' (replication factor Y)
MFLEVALPLPLRQTFWYRCRPAEFDHIQRGQRVLVPFQNRKLTGYAIQKHSQLPSGTPAEDSIKEILGALDGETLVSSEMLRLSEWVADYYFAALGEVLKACLPPKINLSSKKHISLTAPGLKALTDRGSTPVLTPPEEAVLDALARNPELDFSQLQKLTGRKFLEDALRKLISRNWVRLDQMLDGKSLSERQQLAIALEARYRNPLAEAKLTDLQCSVVRCLEESEGPVLVSNLEEKLSVPRSTLKSLEKKGIVRFEKKVVQRDPFHDMNNFQGSQVRVLTAGQKHILEDLEQSINASVFMPVLLHGVTGSGKTEIYLVLIERVLRDQKDSLILMPEIGLTPRVAQEFRSRLGHNVAILHSGLSDGERVDEWWRIRRGEAKVAIGTRSAVFAPLQNLKLIVVDEEHDSSFKQQESPRYHGRDTALMRGKMANALVVLGSATPAIETFYNARIGKYKYFCLPSRVHSRPLPEVKLVDMRKDFAESKIRSILSRELRQGIQDRLDRKEQVLILLNRRGFSAFVLCRSCGQNIQCKNCSISLTYHKMKNLLLCHYCAYAQKVPTQCPRCGSEYLYFLREGTEKVEVILERMFPKARISRLDRDTAKKKHAHSRILSEFQKQEADILLGTQMISKGHDFPVVTLVGILSADHSLAFPDFHCAERTFQLLSQMSGRAGRGGLPGEVLIQTFHPDHYCLKFVTLHDYAGFYEKEIRFRQFMHYPPFSALANVLVRDRSLEAAAKTINLLGELLVACGGSDMKILGPTLSPLAKIKQEHRFQLIVKSKSRAQLKEVLRKSIRMGLQRGLEVRKVHVDIDPVSLM